jgi:hypothetical protein
MKKLLVTGLAAAALLGTPAHAQNADVRSFMHPLGFWSNEVYVKQPKIYPNFRQAFDERDNNPTIFSVVPWLLPLPNPDVEYFGKGGGGVLRGADW